ncbi:MAG: hypothetical protein LBF17_05225 [Mediterranea sp.]|jgi:hypothetical protein|nr:hypothetical protein [Mediterranea sp.]
MDKMKEGLESSGRSKNRVDIVTVTQQDGIKEAKRILDEILQFGIELVDVEFLDDICYDIEQLADYCMPGILKNFRYLFSILYSSDDPKMRPEIIAHVNYLLVLLNQADKYLKLRVEGMELDVTSLVEVHLGYLWNNKTFLEYKMYEEDAEILQMSFNSTKDNDGWTFIDKGYWFDLKSRRIHYTCKIRPINAERYIKSADTEYDVLQPEILFVYPGKTNCRVRWRKAQRRVATSGDMAVLLESAETDYTDVISKLKESFRDPLAERTPTLLIKLHKAFIYDDHLVLEDERGGLLTVKDLSGDNTPTSELLRAILPAQSVGCALLAEVNDNLKSVLFSVKPLSVITPDRIIRLLY